MKSRPRRTRTESDSGAAARAAAVLESGGDATAALAELGFAEPAAAARMLTPLGGAEALARLIESVAVTPAPDLALVALARLAEARNGEDPAAALAALPSPMLNYLSMLAAHSQFLADLLVRHPATVEWLAGQNLARGRTAADFRAEYDAACAAAPAEPRRLTAIKAQRRELLRLALRRLTGRSSELAMARELSELASATLDWAIEELTAPLVARHGHPRAEPENGHPSDEPVSFAVIGMGKLGGGELNFSSDIDLMFVYSREGRTEGRSDGSLAISNHEFYVRLAESLIAWLSEPTEEGCFYRVDMRLRPEGASGPLARSFDAYEIYYVTQAHPWERLALLKGRAVAGDRELGHRFEVMTRPLVHDPLHKERLVQNMRDLKHGIDELVSRRAGGEREIKRGAGGIREIEFLVQTLQMLHGTSRGELDAPATLDAIAALSAAGLLEAARARRMSEDYIFLRTLEHRLQMMHLRQTHMLPAEPAELELLARRCGILPARGVSAGEVLEARRRRVAERVHRDFTDFFEPAREQAAPTDPAECAARSVMSGEPEATALAVLEPFGLAAPATLKMLRRLGGQGANIYLSAEGRRAWGELLPRLLRRAPSIPRPEAAVANLESFLLASGALATMFEMFARAPALFELLLTAMGSGNLLARTLIAHPEFVDTFLDPGELARGAEPDLLRARLERWTGGIMEDEAFCRALGRFKRFEHLAAGLGKLADLIDFKTFNARLCLTAELIVERVLARAAAELGIDPAGGGFAVLAMGKLGAREFNHFTDLDLIFVHDERLAAVRATPNETAAALAERMIALLTMTTSEGRAYAVDARLRPEGASAPLAPPLGRYLDYFSGRAQSWEFQSVMKLRPIAGDAATAAALVEGLRGRIARRLVGLDLAAEIHAMRRRMEQASKPARWAWCDFKVGRGGIVDLEFLAQYLQLKRLGEDGAMMGLGPLAVFARAGAAGWIEPALAETLARDYCWLRRLEDRTRLLFESEHSWLPATGEKLVALERACAPLLEGRGGLLDATGAILLRNRRNFERVLAS